MQSSSETMAAPIEQGCGGSGMLAPARFPFRVEASSVTRNVLLSKVDLDSSKIIALDTRGLMPKPFIREQPFFLSFTSHNMFQKVGQSPTMRLLVFLP